MTLELLPLSLLAGLPDDLQPWVRVYGRLHVALVHFPIALVLAAVWFELIARVRSRPADTALRCLALGVPLALLAGGAGWMNAELEGVSRAAETTLLLHRILGVASVVLALTALIAGRLAIASEGGRSLVVYRLALLAAAGTVGGGAHLGGTLVYGEGYLTAPLRDRSPAPEEPAEPDLGTEPTELAFGPDTGSAPSPGDPGDPVDEGGTTEVVGLDDATGVEDATTGSEDPPAAAGPSFARDVRPIFEEACFRCHGEKRQRAMLRLDLLDTVFEGDAVDWVIQPGDPDASLVVQRITLPPDHEDFMPADGDPLTPEEVETVRAWIAAGAPRD